MNPVYSINAQQFHFELILKKGKSWPIWTIDQPAKIINEIEISEYEKSQLIEFNIEPTINKIILTKSGKTSKDIIFDNGKIVRDQVLTINKIWVNGVLMEKYPIADTTKFYPAYSQDDINYSKQTQHPLPNVLHTTNFFYNGEWHLEFEQPFFVWYNYLLINQLSSVNNWVKQSHLGLADPDKVERLNALLNKLS